MTNERYKEIKDKTKGNQELFYHYFLEEGGKNIPFPIFNKCLNMWFMFNNHGDTKGAELRLKKWMEEKYK